jgi:uroporphyrinogen-III synthase
MSVKGKTILITRQREQSGEFVAEIEKRGGRAVVLPMICITDPDNWEPCDQALGNLPSFDAIVFTSVNSVSRFFARIEKNGRSLPALPRLEVYAVGEKTKEAIAARGLSVTFVPEKFSANDLAQHFQGKNVAGKRFLLPKGNLWKEDLAQHLRALGAVVEAVDVYKNTRPEDATLRELRARVLQNEFDVLTFASPSAVNNFALAVTAEMLKGIPRTPTIAVIGTTTQHAAASKGFPVDIMANESTMAGFAAAIASYFSETEHERSLSQSL